jgi:hypothetical protein
VSGSPGKHIEPPAISTRLGDFRHRQQELQATCSCGRVHNAHLGNLIREFGDDAQLGPGKLAAIARRMKCIRCGERGPKLEIIAVRPKPPL